LESVSAGLRVSRLDSEIDEASNGKAPLLTKRGLSKTVVSVMYRTVDSLPQGSELASDYYRM